MDRMRSKMTLAMSLIRHMTMRKWDPGNPYKGQHEKVMSVRPQERERSIQISCEEQHVSSSNKNNLYGNNFMK